jgi:hypothetical protein
MTNHRQLAMRDPAMAILLLGASAPAGISGAEFGWEPESFSAEFGTEFAAEFANDPNEMFAAGDFGFGDDYGAEFGAPAKALAPPRPTAQQALAAYQKLARAQAQTANRARLIEPNKNSSAKIERYSFTISEEIELGNDSTFTDLSDQPDTTIRPQVVTMNAPTPMFAFVNNIKMANVSITVGSGEEDAYNYNANGWGKSLDMPTLSPSNRATVNGRYTGYLPPGFVGGTLVPFSVNFKGPATIVA